jgi:hypothetical protein
LLSLFAACGFPMLPHYQPCIIGHWFIKKTRYLSHPYQNYFGNTINEYSLSHLKEVWRDFFIEAQSFDEIQKMVKKSD